MNLKSSFYDQRHKPWVTTGTVFKSDIETHFCAYRYHDCLGFGDGSNSCNCVYYAFLQALERARQEEITNAKIN